MGFPSYVTAFFFLLLRFSHYLLIFAILIIVCLGVDLFGFILFQAPIL